MVLGPVAGELGRKRLVVVADGALQYVPFAALPVPAGGASGDRPSDGAAPRGADGSTLTAASRLADYAPLVAEHEVVSLPSASVLALARQELRGRLPAPQPVAVLADP